MGSGICWRKLISESKDRKRGGYFKYIAFRMWHIIFMPFLNRQTPYKRIVGGLAKGLLIFFLVP